EVGERSEALHDLRRKHRGLDELGTPVDYAVADRIDRGATLDDVSQLGLVDPPPRGRDGLRRRDPIGLLEHRELEAARTDVHYEDAHRRRPVQYGQVHARMSGWSSPSIRAYARHRIRSSSIRLWG